MEKSEDFTPDSKDLLLIKCRDTIKQMESEILSEKTKSQQSEIENQKILKELNNLKELYLTFQSKYQEKESDMQDYISKLEYLLENEQEKAERLEQEAQKYSEFISDLQEELKSKQDVLIEWNEAVSEIEEKILKLSVENQNLKDQLNTTQRYVQELTNENSKKVLDGKHYLDAFEGVRAKICLVLQAEGGTSFEEIIKIIELDKKQNAFLIKEKNSLNSKIFELNEKIEENKKVYESKLDEELKKSQKELCRLKLENEKKSEKLKSQKTQNLSLSQQAFKDLIKDERSDDFLKKSEIIQMLKEKIHSIEQSSSKELEFLKSGIESLKECFRLEISKKEQEILLKFQPYEQDLLQEIQNLHDENSKLKTHYSQLLMYKDEEKSLLEQDKNNLKNLIKNLQIRNEGAKSPLYENKISRFETSESFDPRNSFLNERNLRPEHDKEAFQMILERKEQEFAAFKLSFEKRWKKKTKEIQEKVSMWKGKIREDINYLKKVAGQDKAALAIERLEKTVSLII
jgi:hypothetical protein